MARTPLPKIRLEHLLLLEVRTRPGCQNVKEIEVDRMDDPRFEENWKVGRICYGSASLAVAQDAAFVAQDKLRHRYSLE
jgi:hypothetical protein